MALRPILADGLPLSWIHDPQRRCDTTDLDSRAKRRFRAGVKNLAAEVNPYGKKSQPSRNCPRKRHLRTSALGCSHLPKVGRRNFGARGVPVLPLNRPTWGWFDLPQLRFRSAVTLRLTILTTRVGTKEIKLSDVQNVLVRGKVKI